MVGMLVCILFQIHRPPAHKEMQLHMCNFQGLGVDPQRLSALPTGGM